MSNLTSRILTALIAGSVSIAAIVLSPYGLWIFCMIISLVSVGEFYAAAGIQAKRYRYTVLGTGLLIWLYLLLQIVADGLIEPSMQPVLALAFLLLPVLTMIALFDPSVQQPVQTLGALILGFVYPFLPILLFYRLSVPAIAAEYQFWLPLGILLLTWVLDSGAYAVGRLMGKRPLFARISPKKTWEGSIGGAILCLALGVALQIYVPQGACNWIVAAAIISVFSQVGDLVESMFKRSVAIKDSGSILPGHGGMLDRFDGIFLSVPFLYLYFSMC
jgi:phosphatidate cytidylyltransferase